LAVASGENYPRTGLGGSGATRGPGPLCSKPKSCIGGLCAAESQDVPGFSPVEWSYVGEGRGKYQPQDDYNFVGKGAGDFEKRYVIEYQGWRLKKEWHLPLSVLFLTALGIGACVYMFSPRQAHDCLSGVSDWRSSWSDAKKAWCCDKYGRGCPVPVAHQRMQTSISIDDGPVAEALSPAAAAEATKLRLQRAGPAATCDVGCRVGDVTASCRDRIRYAAQHMFVGKPDHCQRAHELVITECATVCPTCALEDSGCA